MNEPLHAPRRIGQSGLHRWRCFQRQMWTAEVVKSDPKRHSGSVMAERFAVGIGQSRETTCTHANGQVDSLNMAGRNLRIFTVSPNLFLNYVAYRRWGVAGFFPWRLLAEYLNELGERDVFITKGQRNGLCIRHESVTGNMTVAGNGIAEPGNEQASIAGIAPADLVSDNQFACAVDCQERIAVAKFFAAVRDLPMLFFATDEGPQFIDLNIIGLDVLNLRGQEPLAAFPDQQQNRHDGVAVDFGESFNGSDAATLQKHPQNHNGLRLFDPQISKWPIATVNESLAA
jgi:hypothetical protein